MPIDGKIINTDCPVCKATGRIDSRLPFRKKDCGECGGTGKIAALRRKVLIRKHSLSGW
jgi:DnaJ-class molecular chaperone